MHWAWGHQTLQASRKSHAVCLKLKCDSPTIPSITPTSSERRSEPEHDFWNQTRAGGLPALGGSPRLLPNFFQPSSPVYKSLEIGNRLFGKLRLKHSSTQLHAGDFTAGDETAETSYWRSFSSQRHRNFQAAESQWNQTIPQFGSQPGMWL